jgi:hypothetical protein
MDKANQLAKVTGAELGTFVSISESDGFPGVPNCFPSRAR